MSWFPIITGIQYADSNSLNYSGAVLKAYSSGTSTPINFATDSTGATEVGSIALNADGNPAVSGNVVLPHVEEKYKLALYPTQAAADANSGAIWTIDKIPTSTDLFSSDQSISSNTSLDSSDADTVLVITGTVTIDLPPLATSPIRFGVINAGTGIVTLDPNAAELINTASTLNVNPGESGIVTPGSSQWNMMGLTPSTLVNNQTAVTSLEAADQLIIADDSASGINKKITIANLLAAQADMEASTARKVVDAANFKYAPEAVKVRGTATVSGGTPTLAADVNLDSVTDEGIGDITFTITDDFSAATYTPNVTTEIVTSGRQRNTGVRTGGRAVGSVRCVHFDTVSDVSALVNPSDPVAWFLNITGDF